jgi:hypothetical protein
MQKSPWAKRPRGFLHSQARGSKTTKGVCCILIFLSKLRSIVWIGRPYGANRIPEITRSLDVPEFDLRHT